MKKGFVLCLMVFCFIGYLSAFPFANYGNVRVPDASVLPHLMAQISLNNYMYPEHNERSDDYAYNWAAAVNFGLFNYGEIGFVVSGDEIYYGHIKGRLIRETLTLPDITIGIDNLFSEVPTKHPFKDHGDIVDAGAYRRNSVYLAISKTTLFGGIPQLGDIPTRVTIGAGTHRFQGTVKMSEQFAGVFGALQFEPFRNFNFITEIDGHNFNTGLKYNINNFAARVDLYRIEEWNRRDPKFGLTLSYTFDQYVSPEDKAGFVPYRAVDPELRGVRSTMEGTAVDELQRIRRQRERAERELEEIRRLLLEED